MNKRVFICGFLNFPRGSASANYVQYLSDAFVKSGYEVIIISNENEKELQNEENYLVKNAAHIVLDKMKFSENRLRHYVEYQCMLGNLVKRILDKYTFTLDDIIVSYSNDPSLNHMIIKLSQKYKIRACACIPEWFLKENFEHPYINIEFYKFWINFNFIFPKYIYTLPISKYIEAFYKKKNCKTLCLPPMADAFEFEYKPKKELEKRKFIYPANGMMKDSIETVLLALGNLTEEELRKIEFHICGLKREYFEKLVPDRVKPYIGESIILHKWMEYNDLIDLYQEMHFLFLARGVSNMTKANFPSKVPETMCYGVVPIVTRVGDYTKYYLQDGVDSIIFDGNSERDCTKAIRKGLSLSTEKLVKLSQQARNTAVTKFDYRNWNKKIIDFLES